MYSPIGWYVSSKQQWRDRRPVWKQRLVRAVRDYYLSLPEQGGNPFCFRSYAVVVHHNMFAWYLCVYDRQGNWVGDVNV